MKAEDNYLAEYLFSKIDNPLSRMQDDILRAERPLIYSEDFEVEDSPQRMWDKINEI